MKPRNYFVFDGTPSTDYGIWLNADDVDQGASRDISTVTVAGRNGDIYQDNNRFNNVEITYTGLIFNYTPERLKSFRSFLSSKYGYCRLEDTFNLDEFRLAHFSSLDVVVSRKYKAATFTLTFSCRPERYLKDGENEITVESTLTTIRNPTDFKSRPLIYVAGYGSLYINGTYNGTAKSYLISFAQRDDNLPIYFDCETANAYRINSSGTKINSNALVTTSLVTGTGLTKTLDIIELPTGEFTLETEGDNITACTVTPRWWQI